MVRLAEDGAMFKIARFRKTIEVRSRATKILVLACGYRGGNGFDRTQECRSSDV